MSKSIEILGCLGILLVLAAITLIFNWGLIEVGVDRGSFILKALSAAIVGLYFLPLWRWFQKQLQKG